jgi:hypothetical protein
MTSDNTRGWHDDPQTIGISEDDVYYPAAMGTFSVHHLRSRRAGKVVAVMAKNKHGDTVHVGFFSEDVEALRTMQMDVEEAGLAVRAKDKE